MTIRSSLRAAGVFAARTLGLALLAQAAAFAHPGHELPIAGSMLAAGFVHPLTGLDHLCAMIAVGLWAASTHENIKQAIWTPVSFLCLLLCGALMGIAGMGGAGAEPMIMASLFVLGLLVASRRSMPGWAAAALVGLFAVFHGIAHGAELPANGSAAAFIAGFMLSTLMLHGVGLAAGFALKRRGAWLTRMAGVGIAAYGVALFTMAA